MIMLSCVVRDITIFEPTHTLREFGLLLSGCRPPAEDALMTSSKRTLEAQRSRENTHLDKPG